MRPLNWKRILTSVPDRPVTPEPSASTSPTKPYALKHIPEVMIYAAKYVFFFYYSLEGLLWERLDETPLTDVEEFEKMFQYDVPKAKEVVQAPKEVKVKVSTFFLLKLIHFKIVGLFLSVNPRPKDFSEHWHLHQEQPR